MTGADALDRARESFRRQDWRETYDLLSATDHDAPLELDDLERLAVAGHMIGRDADSADLWTRAHNECLRTGDTRRAVRCAFWMGFAQLLNGDFARGNGWLARGRRLLDESGHDCVERGYLQVPPGVLSLHEGDASNAFAMFESALQTATRFGDRQLAIMAELGRAQTLILLGNTTEGTSLLDELMVAVIAGEAPPMVTGIVYCAAIEACRHIFDLRRAQEWTAALTHWCASQPGLVPYRRQCLVHRSEIMQLHGAWPDALEEARRAGDLLMESSGQPPAAGAAFYQQAELYRLWGEFSKAEEGYRMASRWGRNPQPGLALLRLAQGQVEAAAAAARLMLDETRDPAERATSLPAYVEIMLAAGDVQSARAGADELAVMAEALEAPLLSAVSGYANGAVLLREGEARAALSELRRAFAGWQAIEAPYEAARARVLVGLACRALGDHDTEEMEFDAARWLFQKLGAAPDLARAEALSPRPASKTAAGLTGRELEVLRLVASGKTNHAIAADLFISDHTVRRHLQNIFVKLGVSSRAAATAFAFQHDLT